MYRFASRHDSENSLGPDQMEECYQTVIGGAPTPLQPTLANGQV